MPNPIFEVLKSENDQFYWHLETEEAEGGEILAWSGEVYENLSGCLNGLYSFKSSAFDSSINDLTDSTGDDRIADTEFEVFEDAEQEFRWRFQAPNNQVVAVSGEGYERAPCTTIGEVEEAISDVKEAVQNAKVVVDLEDPVDVEECDRRGERPPEARHYRIRVGKDTYIVKESVVTGEQILRLAGKSPPNRWRLDQKLRGGQTNKVGLDEEVHVCEPGVERFLTIPLDQQEGSPVATDESRQEFQLPSEDREFLDSLDQNWEAVEDGNKQWILIHDYPLPDGYTASAATLAFQIPPSYPTAQIDMVYLHPPVRRKDGKGIPNVNEGYRIDGQDFQRWSRHRTSENEWRPGIDGVDTHLASVESWFEREFE
jgi:uncharacterized protein YegP (UPF0339 family)